jgi:hypothetical protein
VRCSRLEANLLLEFIRNVRIMRVIRVIRIIRVTRVITVACSFPNMLVAIS